MEGIARLEQGECIHCIKMNVKTCDYKGELADKDGSGRMKFSSDFLNEFR